MSFSTDEKSPYAAVVTITKADRHAGYLVSLKSQRNGLTNPMVAWIVDVCMEFGIHILIDTEGQFRNFTECVKPITDGVHAGPNALEVDVQQLLMTKWHARNKS